MNITVNGQQYSGATTTPGPTRLPYVDMVVPVGVTVMLDITARRRRALLVDPELGGKADAVPGYVNHSWFRIPADAIRPATRWSSPASAPSCAAATTRTCTRA